MNEEKLIVRPALKSDVDDIYVIEKQSFTDAWTKEAFHNELENNEIAHYYVVEEDGVVVAYIGYWKILDQGHITNIAVLPEYRKNGIAKLLINKIFEDSKITGVSSYTLECRVSNKPAITLYESFGFESCGIRPNYYIDNNEDAYIMWKEL